MCAIYTYARNLHKCLYSHAPTHIIVIVCLLHAVYFYIYKPTYILSTYIHAVVAN